MLAETTGSTTSINSVVSVGPFEWNMLEKYSTEICSICCSVSCHSPFASHRPWIVFHCLRLVAFVWKKLVFQSPSVSQKLLERCLHMMFSTSSQTFKALWTSLISISVVVVLGSNSSSYSFFCKPSILCPTCPNSDLFHAFNLSLQFSRQFVIWWPPGLYKPSYQDSRTTFAQWGSRNHISSNLKVLFDGRRWWRVILERRDSMERSEVEDGRWWRTTPGKSRFHSLFANALSRQMHKLKNFEQACDCFNNGSFTVKNT